MRQEISFEIDSSQILNANVSKHPMVKSKIASALRNMGSEAGIEMHPEGDSRELAKKHLVAVRQRENFVMLKKRAKARLKKGSKMTEKELNAQVEETYKDEKPNIAPEDVGAKYLFSKYKTTITVSPPTKRRLDPPNLYLTVKPLIDGMTDAAVWEDDSFDYMEEMSFRYGGATGKASKFVIRILVEDI